MRLGYRFLSVFAFVALAIGGCSDVYTPPETAPLNFTVHGTDGGPPDPWISWPLEGVRLCEGDTENCEISDANGLVIIELPVGEIFYTLQREGYDSVLIAQDHPEGGRTTWATMWTNALRATFYEWYESVYPRDGRGEIKIDIVPIPFPGATFDLVDATGKQYFDTENPLDATATGHWGIGGFLEVNPGGPFTVEYGGAASRCSVDFGWPSGEDSVRVPVRENHVSQVLLGCALP